MKQQFKLYRRSNGKYYAENTTTGKQSSLGTRDKAEANRLLHARNEAAYQPAFNRSKTIPTMWKSRCGRFRSIN